MKKLVFFLSLLAMVMASSSCNTQVKKERLKRIDSLGIHLNYVREAMTALDSQLIHNRIMEIDQNQRWVYDNIVDTLPKRQGLAFGDYMRTNKYFNQAASRYRDVGKELRYSEKQLNTLRTDVQNNFYSEEEFSGYFQAESESIAELVAATDELKQKYELSTGRYQKYKPIVKEMIDSIKSVIYASEPVTP